MITEYFNLPKSLTVIGKEIRTSNDQLQCATDIPRHWDNCLSHHYLSNIPNKLSDDIYALYTNFQYSGHSSDGTYSYVLGCSVSSDSPVPNGYTKHVIPTSEYQVFVCRNGPPESVVNEKWKEIWTHTFQKKRTFYLEFEKYSDNQSVSIFIGVKPG